MNEGTAFFPFHPFGSIFFAVDVMAAFREAAFLFFSISRLFTVYFPSHV